MVLRYFSIISLPPTYEPIIITWNFMRWTKLSKADDHQKWMTLHYMLITIKSFADILNFFKFYIHQIQLWIIYNTGTAMNARASENYLAISRSSSASKSVEIFWAEIYWGRLFFRAESSLIQASNRQTSGESASLPQWWRYGISRSCDECQASCNRNYSAILATLQIFAG